MNVTMSQKLSLIQSARSVPRALTSDRGVNLRRLFTAVPQHQPRSNCRISYLSSASESASCLGVVNRTDSYSVTRTTPGTGSSITSMIVSSTIGAFFGAIFAGSFGGLFFLAIDFRTRVPVCRTLDFAFFGLICLAAFLALTLPRFELFLLVARRFFALA